MHQPILILPPSFGAIMNRRQLLGILTASTAAAGLPRLAFARTPGISLSLEDAASGPTIPADYVGLSYDAAHFATPDFFPPSTQALIAILRQQSLQGVRRTGGRDVECTRLLNG